MRLHLGIDDTDSLAGGCTTRIATGIALSLLHEGAKFVDYPNLIRLNPNVPWKTRGNGAVCLRIESDLPKEAVLGIAASEIERSSDLTCPGTDPGVVLLEGSVPPAVVEFSKDALTSMVSLDRAISLIKSVGAEALGYGSAQGVIGALGAIGAALEGDHTYEFIAYRSSSQIRRPRLIDADSIIEMNDKTRDQTFNNIDPETGRVLITPRGPDPILCGVRGESPEAVRGAFRMLRINEPVDASMIFRTNQGTDAHLVRDCRISGLEDNCAIVVLGVVAERPVTIRGGHVIFLLGDETGSVHCAAYEPTGKFRDAVRLLAPGDKVRAFGGVRPASDGIPRTINLEKLEILEVVARVTTQNPLCSVCSKRMESAGVEQGFRCRRCGTKSLSKMESQVAVDLKQGTCLPPPRAHRHLTKPFARYGREQRRPLSPPVSDWCFVQD